DNATVGAALGLSLPLAERVSLDHAPGLRVAARPLGSGVLLREFSGGLQVRTREEAPAAVLGLGLSRSYFREGWRSGQLGVQARAGLQLQPGAWIVEPALELTGMQGGLPYSTAVLSLRLGRVLAPAPAPR
ncbi:MAG: hypothetical protein H6740_29365, partial [Alphaproteobacteria bacterium]|nr:hypothetical protein [Alphaproteobacteria bacterium]